MAYDRELAARVRLGFSGRTDVTELSMMGGLCFMVNAKMCVGVYQSELMVRIDPTRADELLARPGCRVMDFTGKPMKGFVVVDPAELRQDKDLAFWLEVGLAYNGQAKAVKKTKRSPG